MGLLRSLMGMDDDEPIEGGGLISSLLRGEQRSRADADDPEAMERFDRAERRAAEEREAGLLGAMVPQERQPRADPTTSVPPDIARQKMMQMAAMQQQFNTLQQPLPSAVAQDSNDPRKRHPW